MEDSLAKEFSNVPIVGHPCRIGDTHLHRHNLDNEREREHYFDEPLHNSYRIVATCTTTTPHGSLLSSQIV